MIFTCLGTIINFIDFIFLLTSLKHMYLQFCMTISWIDSKYIFRNMIWVQAFVSEYAVWKTDAGRGTLLASLAEAAFLTGLEKNRWNRFKYLTRFLSVGYMVITPESLCVNFKWCICQSSHHDLIVLYFDGFFRDSDVVEMACHAPLFVNDDIEKKFVFVP